MQYRLLDAFEALFKGKPYLHRNSTLGDKLAREFYEDLLVVDRSPLFKSRVTTQESVVNISNTTQGIRARRGDGTFGEIIPGIRVVVDPGFHIGRGPTANVEIGVEVKVLAKAMIKQITRVTRDLRDQVGEFHRAQGTPICVGFVGINHTDHCVSYEGDREWRTDGKIHKHPAQEAVEAEKRIVDEAKSKFDELLFLRYRATNEDPFDFEWLNYLGTFKDYGAVLTRVARKYDTRFGPG